MSSEADSAAAPSTSAIIETIAENTTEEKKVLRVKLESNDGETIEVDEDVAYKSRLIKNMMNDLRVSEASDSRLEDALPITEVNGKTLKKIFEYCEKHRDEEYKPKGEHEDPRIQLTEDDKTYMDVSNDELVQILLGANFLDIPGIVDIITQKIASMAEGKTVEELREIYGLENDFTAEEEEEIRQRFAWVEV